MQWMISNLIMDIEQRPECYLRTRIRINSTCGQCRISHQPMALKVSYTARVAPPFNTGQPCAIRRASSIEFALITV